MDKNQYHKLLSDPTRRAVIDYSHEHSQTTLDTLADSVANALDEDVSDVRISLVHVHLPMLDDAGVLDYDPDERTITADRDAIAQLAD